MTKTRVFSGVQPTGNLHLGNYLGAVKQWVDIQHDYDQCMFCIVDLHAITVPQDPQALRDNTRTTAAAYIAAGIDPEKHIIFHQSAVSGHAELAWLLGCHTPLGWLNRMTQFKEKAGKSKDQAVLGLYSYPVLMAADILLYGATHVPVGEDQKQHLELTRDIAGAFNRHYDREFFTLPEPLILGEATRVMSLRDGTKKMSKSDDSDYSRINLTDDADTIVKKIKKAKSDAEVGISYDPDNRPEASNLLTIYAVLAGMTKERVADQFASSGFGEFKKALADLAVETIAPITQKISELTKNSDYLDQILKRSAEQAAALSESNMKQIKDVIGFLS